MVQKNCELQRIVKNPKKSQILEDGRIILSREEAFQLDADSISWALREYNQYRRSEGKYKFSEKPEQNVRFPLSGTLMGYIIEDAADLIDWRLHD